MFGGIGYGFGENSQAGVFIGSLDTTQRLGMLGSETRADGFALGAYANTRLGGLGIHAMIARIGSDAVTTRSLAATSSAAVGHYDLDSWVADLTVDYGMALGDLRVAPRLGLTYVDTRRDAVTESGGGAFPVGRRQADAGALWRCRTATVVDVRRRRGLGRALCRGGLSLHPRRRVGDRGAANLAAGASIDIAPSVRVNVGYSRDLAKIDRGAFSGGLSIRF